MTWKCILTEVSQITTGIRRGTDVLKALALGANYVFVGRPALYGLAYDGQPGVEKVIDILTEELKRSMILTGCLKLSDVGMHVIHKAYSAPWLAQF